MELKGIKMQGFANNFKQKKNKKPSHASVYKCRAPGN